MLYFICFFGGCIGSCLSVICGFGVGVFSMMLLPFFMSSTIAASTMINFISFVLSIFIIIHYRKKLHLRALIVPVLACLLACLLTDRYLISLSNNTLKAALGVIFLLLSAWFLFAANRVHIRASAKNAVIAGSLSGVLTTLFGVGGPPMGVYYSSIYDDKEEYLANVQALLLVEGLYVTVLRVIDGLVTGEVISCTAFALIGVACGTCVGKRIFDRINADTIRKAIYMMMAISGFTLLLGSK